MDIPETALELIERFNRNRDAYLSGAYNEFQLRKEFLDPLFEALGWDMQNKLGYAEAYKDVIHEDSIKVGGFTKAPDYCFRIGGTRKFFVEAKKPSVKVKDDTSPAFQLRRYAWSAKLPLSILSDFEEFAVYDCRIKPVKTDKASTARILYLTYEQYPEKWREIASIFARDSILKGSFDSYVETTKGKKGTAEVDAAFLKEIESWRDSLARNLALRNPGLSQRELNYAVQTLIDRIIFLRMCEDRGIEEYGRLMALQNGSNVYGRLFELFQRADERYNSGLFHFRDEKGRNEAADQLTPTLNVEDKPLKDIIKNLYYPDSPYEFAVLPADILGQVYEQFLGKVIRLTTGHRAVVEDKPEVKKAGGVYYTPTYIVEYIVENTVAKLLEGKSPKQASKLRILDPACGSGSFLIRAYQHLMDWHRDRYVEDSTKKHTKEVYQGPGGEWRLTTAERKRILLNNIFGVDIDPQAVEVTKLSLLLKVLEGESDETLAKQLQLFHERALPDLSQNVRCGNTLIGQDYYDELKYRQLSLIDEEDRLRVNAFDWNSEFPEIMKAGGFDAVVGNPPYVFTREQLSSEERSYFSKHYLLSWEKHNTYMLFMETMLRLLSTDGIGSFIVPNSWLTIESAKLLRKKYAQRIELLADLNYLVFDGISMEPSIFVISGQDISDEISAFRVSSKADFSRPSHVAVDRTTWTVGDGRFTFSHNTEISKIIDELVERCSTIGVNFNVLSGLQAYEKGKGRPPQTAEDVREHIFDRDIRQDASSLPYLQGRDIGRYQVAWSGQWLQYGPWLSQPREIGQFTRPRILLREITGKPPYCMFASFIEEAYLSNKSVLSILHPGDDIDQLKLLLAVLNSRLISVYYKARAVKSARKIFPKVVIKNVREFPFPEEVMEKALKRATILVDRIQALLNKLQETSTPADKTSIQRQVESTDKQIDQFVYELYGLTDGEIEIVEQAAPKQE